jgi:hypothetical protein
MNRTNLIEDLTLLPMPSWWESPWAWVAGFLALALLALAGVRWWRYRLAGRAAIVTLAPEPDRTQEFLERLEALRKRKHEFTPYELAIRSSDLLREFVEWRFRLNIRFQTTREFLEAASRDSALPPAERERLGSFLRFCDLVKFARRGATDAELSGLLDTAGAFIRPRGNASPLATSERSG